jgi:hypothetical protein
LELVQSLCAIDSNVCQQTLLLKGHLALNSSNRICSRESISFLKARNLGFPVGRDDDRTVDSLVDAGFEQERHIVDDDCVWVLSSRLPCKPLLLTCDAWMDDPFELSAFRLIVEDDASESLPVERAVLIEHGFSEECDDLSPSRFAGFDDLMGQVVGIDHDRAALLEHLGNGAFSGRDAACEANENHGGGA